MAQTPEVEKRVRTILAPGKNRAEVTGVPARPAPWWARRPSCPWGR
jgi:hypothetical protein